MQNKANFPNAQILVNCVLTMDYVNIRLRSRFKNKAKQTQFKANLSQLKPISKPNKANSNPNKPNQTQPVVSLSNLFQTSPACRGEASGEAGSQQFQNFARLHLGNPGLINVGFCEEAKTILAFDEAFCIKAFSSTAN